MTVIPVHREIEQSPVDQGIREIVIYTLNTTPWGGSPASPEIYVTDITDLETDVDVADEVMPINDPQIDEDTIMLSPLKDLALDSRYRIDILWTSAGNTFNAYAIINATK